MARKFFPRIILIILALYCCPNNGWATGGEDGDERNENRRRMMEGRMSAEYEKPPQIVIEEIIQAKRPRPVLPEGRFSIREVSLSGATVFTAEQINSFILPYQDRELDAQEIIKCADAISAAYEKRGYIGSYAFVAADKISGGILEITAQELKVGDIQIKENKYFSTRILEKKLGLKRGQVFNSKALQRDILRISRHPDRKVNFLLKRGKEPGTIDIVLLVKDKLPLHLTLETDNYGSEYILYRRYKAYLGYYNILGNDDTLTFKVQRTDAGAHQLYDITYVLPVSNRWKFDLYYMPSKVEDYYYSNNKDTDFEKHAQKFYFNFYQTLADEPNLEVVSTYGFVYKDIFWFQSGQRQAWDRFRALVWGLDFNRADKWGRTVISNDVEVAIPRMWGGAAAKDDSCSVISAGGAYKKNHLVVARKQKLFAGIDFLFKSHWQLSSHAQPGVNVFSVGGFMGVIDMRGYPRAQMPGDGGRSLTAGFSFPAYLVPKSTPVPFSKGKLYDALKLFTFFDWAEAILKSPKEGQEKKSTLSSVGCGLTFTLPENFSARMDVGFPIINRMGKDNDHTHIWYSATKRF